MAKSRKTRSPKSSERRPRPTRRVKVGGGVARATTRRAAAPSPPSKTSPPHSEFPIVAVGASAGGVEAAQDLFSRLPQDSGLAFVLLLHLDPTRESLVDRVIAAGTRIPVVQASDGVRLQPNCIYVAPPGHPLLTIHGGVLSLGRLEVSRQTRLPIDGFLTSLAEDQREQSACVILSGSGNDGARGVREIVAAGGVAIVQDPLTASFDGMPHSAVATGAVDYVLPIHEIPEVLLRLARVRRGPRLDGGESSEPMTDLLASLRQRLGIDFNAYKKRTLLRRIQRRMVLRHVESVDDYIALLRDDGDEAHALARDFLIGVTEFFRQPEAWELLEKEVIQPLVRRAIPGRPIRVWVAGCATGEEAYSVAMLFLEQIGKSGHSIGLQVFASDVSEEALAVARAGRYSKGVETHLSPLRLRRFFTRDEAGDHWQVRKELRDLVVFATHNIFADPPYSHVDLICCRNLLIYLEPGIQQSVLSVFRFALRPDGYLFLGPAESVGEDDGRFRVVSKKWRVFRRAGEAVDARAVLLSLPKTASHQMPHGPPGLAPPIVTARENRLGGLAEQLVLERFAPAAVLVNGRNETLHLSGPTDQYLRHPRGAPTHDLLQLAREGLTARLREALAATQVHATSVEIKNVRVKRRGGFYPVRVSVLPVPGAASEDGPLRLVVFEEDPHSPSPRHSRGKSSEVHIVRQLENELLVARSELKTSLDQLESSNEAYRAANEEAMSINEELQASNEELETSREELQSLNEELTTVNVQLQQKVTELEQSTNDLANLLASTEIATVCLDREYRIKWFTPATTSLLNLRTADLGRPITDFARRFRDGDLIREADTVIRKLTPIEHTVRADDGRWLIQRVLPYRTDENKIEGVVVTYTDITNTRRAEEALQALNETLERRVELRTRDLKLLHEAAVIANESRSLGEAVAETLALMCHGNGWALGHALLARTEDPTTFADIGVWWRAPSREGRGFERAVGQIQFRSGPDAVGRAIATGQPQWVADLSATDEVPWAEAARAAGLQSALIMPVSVRLGVVAVLELFADRRLEVDDAMRDVMHQISIQLGRVIERSRFEARLTGFADEERRQIAHELHDGMGQRLVGLGLLAASLRKDLEARGIPEAARVAELVRNIDEGRSEVRALTKGLLPVQIEADGLMSALEELAAQFHRLPNVDCRFVCDVPVAIQDNTVATHLFRIAQEAVRNAVEHGRASGVMITLENGDRIVLTVRDNGVGMQRGVEGDGLRIMGYRARHIGGSINLDSIEGEGTVVTCTVPRTPSGARAAAVLFAESRAGSPAETKDEG
jgi:two-component system CheB/CheR fusion protein